MDKHLLNFIVILGLFASSIVVTDVVGRSRNGRPADHLGGDDDRGLSSSGDGEDLLVVVDGHYAREVPLPLRNLPHDVPIDDIFAKVFA